MWHDAPMGSVCFLFQIEPVEPRLILRNFVAFCVKYFQNIFIENTQSHFHIIWLDLYLKVHVFKLQHFRGESKVECTLASMVVVAKLVVLCIRDDHLLILQLSQSQSALVNARRCFYHQAKTCCQKEPKTVLLIISYARFHSCFI